MGFEIIIPPQGGGADELSNNVGAIVAMDHGRKLLAESFHKYVNLSKNIGHEKGMLYHVSGSRLLQTVNRAIEIYQLSNDIRACVK